MSKARDLADFSSVAPDIGRKNLIINGAMQVAQRGTSSTSNGYATVDRFQFSITSTDEFASTKTQEADGPDGFPNSFKVVATTPESSVASNERLRIIHFVEAQDLQHLGFGTSSAKSTTLSFYVKSNVTGTYGFSMYQGDSGRLIGGTYTINSADTWEQKTLTFAGDTSGTINNDNGQGFGMEWYLLAGSGYTGTNNTSWVAGSADKRAYGHTANWGETTSDYFQITGVQLEVGTVATPFEHRSYGEELELCQRYTQVIDVNNDRVACFTGGNSDHLFTENMLMGVMRSTPSLSTTDIITYDNYYINTYNQSSAAIYRNSGATTFILADVPNFSGLTQNSAGCIRSQNGALIILDAEL